MSVRLTISAISAAIALQGALSLAEPISGTAFFSSRDAPFFATCSDRLGATGASELLHDLETVKLAALGNEHLTNLANEAVRAYAITSECLLWVRDGKPTSQATQLLSLLEGSAEKGLDPSDYDGHWGATQISDLLSVHNRTEADTIRFDVALTVAAIRYVSDLHSGRANPSESISQRSSQGNQLDVANFVATRCVSAVDLPDVIGSVEPPFLAYRRTLSALATYRKLSTSDEPPNLSAPPYAIEPGIAYKDLDKLRKRLQLLGDLSASTSKNSQIYDVESAEAVARFQQRHGLEPNGRLDATTVRELNTPLAKRVKQLELTLERWRWLPPAYSGGPIVVNIPEFRLHIVDDERHITASMNVVVGRAYHHQTPVFQGTINSVLFRPPWNVPLEIQRRELVPLIEEDPDYLEKNSYDVLDGFGTPIPDSMSLEETIAGLKDGRLFLRQRPGDENSLGLIKFDLPNPYNVYLHGTPAQELFSKTRRDFSHGCVRVEDPVALAVWLLRANPGWTKERIEEAMHGEETLRVALAKPVPIWIVYGTAVVLEDGRVRFFRDVYGQDAALEEQLQQLKKDERSTP